MINVNEYFGGAVRSLGYAVGDGKSTVGVIETGEYEFGTAAAETMTVIEGELVTLLPGAAEWVSFTSGRSFHVPANSSFKVRTEGHTSYLCKYH